MRERGVQHSRAQPSYGPSSAFKMSGVFVRAPCECSWYNLNLYLGHPPCDWKPLPAFEKHLHTEGAVRKVV